MSVVLEALYMRTLIIEVQNSMLSDLEGLLHSNGVMAYTLLSNAEGNDIMGRVYGSFVSPDINTIIYAVLQPDKADRAVNALKRLHTGRKEASSDDNPPPLKVFSFPCEEHA
jgi:hypothetical protein